MIDFSVKRFKTLDSTNTYLKSLAEKGEKEGTVIVADAQEKGRGRRGKSFFSPADTGLYMSFLLRPKLPPEEALFITTATAVAVARAIESVTKKRALIKWVNDVYLDERKVAGILTESAFSADSKSLDYVVVGIGVNINTKNFPDEIKDIATSLGESDVRDDLLQNILLEFSHLYSHFPSHSFFEEYKSRSLLIGKEIEIVDDGRCGVVYGINDDCHLLVRLNSGEKISLSSGEVSTRLKKQ